jgi:hypothetical protein
MSDGRREVGVAMSGVFTGMVGERENVNGTMEGQERRSSHNDIRLISVRLGRAGG